MIDISCLTSDIFDFVSTNNSSKCTIPTKTNLKDGNALFQQFKLYSDSAPACIDLAKYLAVHQKHSLAIDLMSWLSDLDTQQYKYHYFKAVIQFSQHNIPETLAEIENMLISMKASTVQITQIISKLQEENKNDCCIFFLKSLLKEFNLPTVDREFNFLILPYNVISKDNLIRYYYCLFFIDFCHTLNWTENDELSSLLSTEFEMNGASPWYHLCMANLFWIQHDRKQADYHFKQAKSLSIEQNLLLTTEACGLYTWLSDEDVKQFPQIIKTKDSFELDMWEWVYADLKSDKPDLSIILGCDFKYFKYFPKFLYSLIQAHIHNDFLKKTIVSLCLDSPSPEQVSFLNKIADYTHRNIPNFYLTFGYGFCPYQEGAYFASIRYLFAPELFELYPAQTFIIDIDVCAHLDFYSETESIKENYDFGLRLFAFDRDGNQMFSEPWCLGAGVLYLGDLEKTRLIVRFLKDYVICAYDSMNPSNWCIDQCALAQAYEYYIRPFWKALYVVDIDSNSPFILSQAFDTKDQFYQNGGVINMENFIEKIDQLMIKQY